MRKGLLIGFILGGIIFGSIGVYAAYKYNAKDIGYKDTNVDAAINNLYDEIGSVKYNEILIIHTESTWANAFLWDLSSGTVTRTDIIDGSYFKVQYNGGYYVYAKQDGIYYLRDKDGNVSVNEYSANDLITSMHRNTYGDMMLIKL